MTKKQYAKLGVVGFMINMAGMLIFWPEDSLLEAVLWSGGATVLTLGFLKVVEWIAEP